MCFRVLSTLCSKLRLTYKKKLHEIFRCGHQKGSWVDKNHKEKSKFSDIRLIFWHFPLFFLTRIITPWNKKKCSKGYAATIFITGYYYWRINFFFQNRLTSGWDTAKFFLKKKAPTKWQKPNLKEIFKIVWMCFSFWKIMTSKIQKTEIFKYGKIRNWDFQIWQTLLCSIIFINILSQMFWSSGEDSELQNRRSWVQTPPRGNMWF